MDKLDRLVWATGVSFTSYGLSIGIRVSQPEVMDQVMKLLPPGWKPGRYPVVDRLYSLVAGGATPRNNVKRFNLVYVGVGRLARSLDLNEALQILEADLRLYVAERARGRLFVHAGVVGWRGKAIVLPGRSFCGKSTLVAALVRAGATYYSDEYAVLDARGRVHPYLVPLSLRTDPEGAPKRIALEGCPVETGLAPLPVGAIVVTQFQADARWRPRQVTPGQAVLSLLSNTVAARRRPMSAFKTLSHLVVGVPVLQGKRGEADEMAARLLETVGG